ncbi:MAG TPA: YbhB/YbcL family Raf kinase inhibitor-like protein [Pseudolabrys sp.]|jgi:Raf kinase inhibitor-like YbhB/YbcL family protein|nr:YbhB/YbcL family Raf kinase inhibitor-like protein [Pseudolabrys sp.]
MIGTRQILAAAGILLVTGAAYAADPFTLTSSNFKDGMLMDSKHAGNIASNKNCIGQNISPDLKWSNTPAAAKSLVLVMSDSEGQGGLGSHHLVAYNIAPTVTGFAENELGKASDKFTGGKESAGKTVYRGPCTPPGTGLHHYVFMVIATDLEPGALPAGLTRDELQEKLKGHAKAAAGLVGLFGRP